MSRIVVLVDLAENRRLLVEWLAREHEVIVPNGTTALDLLPEFDLGIVDGPSLERFAHFIDAAKRSAEPLFLPFLLVTHPVAPAARGRASGMSLTARAWRRVDELIASPVEKVELHARVETLLRARTLSLANDALHRRLERELARAREVQASLLPVDRPALPGFDLAARCVPANEVGGDFYDWEAKEDATVLSVGDVMGKGIPAALLAATVRAVLRALSTQNTPGPTLDLLARTLHSDLERTASFATLFHARLGLTRREVRYVDAGHGHALVRRANGAIQRLERGGRPVGFPVAHRYREAMLRLGCGDMLFVYSDGLCDGVAREAEALLTAAVGAPSLGPPTTGAAPPDAASIVDRIVARAPKLETADDLTVLVLKCVDDSPSATPS